MRQCCPDGTLRAFLDRELPAEDLARVSAHIEECARCGARSRELSARAERVMELVGGLAEPGPSVPMARPPVTAMGMPRRSSGRWALGAAVAAALAAGWAALALLAPKPVQAPAETHISAPPAVAPAQVAPSQVAAFPTPRPLPVRAPSRVAPRPLARAFPSAAPRATLAGFMALDDDPIDAGVVMRVALADGRMQADVIYSPDGRPRAIRLVNETPGK